MKSIVRCMAEMERKNFFSYYLVELKEIHAAVTDGEKESSEYINLQNLLSEDGAVGLKGNFMS